MGDPAKLLAVRDIFGTRLWQKFAIMVPREVKRATDPQLTSILTKNRIGICDKEVLDVLQTRFQSHDLSTVAKQWLSVQLWLNVMRSIHSVWRGYGAMLLVMKLVILINLRKADFERLQHCT